MMVTLDIVGGRTSLTGEHIILYKNDGVGVFTKDVIISNGGSLVKTITHADFNKDGLPDIVYGSDKDIAVLLSNGSDFDKITIGEGEFFKVDVGDMNGDGNMDIVATRNLEMKWYRTISDGSISFEERQVGPEVKFDLIIGDFDNDGDIDMVGANDEFIWVIENKIPQIPSSNKSTLLADAYSLGPNPSHDEIILRSLSSNQLTFQLFDLQGQLVLSGQEGVIDISGFDNGAYLLNITDKESGKMATEKIVKQ